jgi:excisionase family DNA binding protein
VGEDRTDAHSVGRARDRLTIAEAATLLGVHKNTVRNRIKNGSYQAEMIQTERGPTYLIERESLLTNLSTNTLSSASQQLVGPQAMEFVQELLRPFVSELGEVREELGAERARRQMAEQRAAGLEAELEALRHARESPESVDEEPERAEPHPAASGPQTAQDTSPRGSLSDDGDETRGAANAFKRLSVWGYGLGVILTGMTGFLMQLGLGYQIFQRLGLGLPNDVVFRYGVGWGLPLLLPIIFGYQVGRKPRGNNFWRHVGITALLAALASFLPWAIIIVPQTGTSLLTSNEVSTIFFEATRMWLPVGLAFLSSALIGNARRRRVAGPTPSAGFASKQWSPLTLTLIGIAGNILAAAITGIFALAGT